MTKFGIDISTWDSPINWDLAKSKVDFTFIKAFEYQKDNRYDEHWNSSKGKVARGAYYFWRQSPDSIDKVRTQQFLDVIGGSNYNGELPVVIDLEDAKANRSTVFGQMDRLSETIKNVTGRYPIIYTGMSYWKEIGGPTKASQYWCDVHPLWISLPNLDYRVTFEQEYQEIMEGTRMPYIPKVPPFKTVDFIQWTYRGKPEDVPGYSLTGKKAVDFNFYLGTDDEYSTFFAGNPTPIEYTMAQKVDILWNEYIKNK